MMKRMVLCYVLLLLFSVPANGYEATFRLGHVVSEDDVFHVGAVKFATLIEEYTERKIRIEIYPGGVISSGERELVEALQLGTLDMAVITSGPISNFYEKMMVVDLPYLFKDDGHVDRVLDSTLGMGVLKGLEEVGLKGLFWMERGFRSITNHSRLIIEPEDLIGQKYRLMENPVHLKTFQVLGADPTPMAWGEVYTSLQTGVIDGQENPVGVIYTEKIYEVQETITLTGHFYSPAVLLMNLDSFLAMPLKYQELALRAAREAGQFARDINREKDKEYVTLLQEEYGVKVIYREELDLFLWEEAVRPVYDWFYEEYPIYKSLVESMLVID